MALQKIMNIANDQARQHILNAIRQRRVEDGSELPGDFNPVLPAMSPIDHLQQHFIAKAEAVHTTTRSGLAPVLPVSVNSAYRQFSKLRFGVSYNIC